MQNPANLRVWHRAIDLAVRISRVASRVNATRAPGMASQLRRASASFPANIAEGAGQQSPAQCARFIAIAIGSAFELESHLVLVQRLQPELADLASLVDETQQVRRMMHAFRAHLLRVSAQQKLGPGLLP